MTSLNSDRDSSFKNDTYDASIDGEIEAVAKLTSNFGGHHQSLIGTGLTAQSCE